MKILKGRVDWAQGRPNRPSLYLLVDAIPPSTALRFTKRKDLYFAEHEGLCMFFMWREERRPVSATVVNDAGYGPCMEVNLTDDLTAYVRGEFRSGAVLVSLLRDYASVIDVGTGFTWRPGSSYAAEVAFPATSCFTLACAGNVVQYTRSGRDERFWAMPEVLPDGIRIEDVRAAIFVAEAVGEHGFTQQSLAAPYVRYFGADAYDVLLALSSFEPAVQLPDGTFWVKPE